jgi:hypothetical protein
LLRGFAALFSQNLGATKRSKLCCAFLLRGHLPHHRSSSDVRKTCIVISPVISSVISSFIRAAMQFQSGRWAANVTRISERRSLDSLDVDRVMAVAAELKKYVGGWGVMDVALVKIARFIVERQLSPARVGEIIEATMIRLRLPAGHKYKPNNPGGYFMASIKKELELRGHSWNRRDGDED